MNLFPPNVEAISTSVQIGDTVAFASLFEASDLDGNPITAYRFRDNNASLTSGYFTVRGEIQPSNVLIEVPAADLSFVRYHAGLIVGTETFSVQVSDGERLSNVDAAQIFTVVGNFFPPVITPIDSSVLESERIDASSLFTVSDPEGNEILSYFVVDRKVNQNGGHFLLNGARQPSGVFFQIDADQLDNLVYVGGRFGQTENVAFQAFDGEFYSDITDIAVTTIANMYRPETTAFNINSRLGRVIAAESMFAYSDQDGNTLKSVGFLDTGTAADSGYFTINGVRQDAGSYFFVPAAELGSVKYNVANSSDSEIYRVITNDGRFNSVPASATVTAIPRPELGGSVGQTIILDALEQVELVDFVSQIDDGPDLNLYQVIDQNEGINSARLVLDGEFLEAGVLHTMTALEFANLELRAGTTDIGRTADEILVRGRNELFFTDWEEIRVNTEAVGARSLTSLNAWPDTIDDGEKFILTYTFIDGVDDVDDNTTPPVPSYYPDDADERDNPFPLDPAMRQAVRQALDLIETYADVEYVEVPFDIDASEATLIFGLREGFDAGVAANARLPDNFSDGRGNVLGDIWYNRETFPENGTFTGPGSAFFVTTLHEVGHTLGFKHPRAPELDLNGDPIPGADAVLPVASDFWFNTVMSTVFAGGPTPASFGIYDIQEIQRLYRPNEEHNLGNDHYFFEPGQLETIYDAGGRDTFNRTVSVVPETINLNQGEFSTVNGIPRSAAVALGTVIENARGGGAGDLLIGNSVRNLLFGNGGNDILEGNGGNDVLRGGEGRDTYIWRTGDGRDRIDEQRKAGVDAIHIIDDTALSSLADDLVFRRFGRDLRIDLRFNRGAAQGTILVKDQQFGGSRVETLRFFNTEGDQIGVDIDLDSIFQQANTTAQFFTLTNQENTHGYIAIPT